MNCFDCADFGITSEAVAVCADCGAGLCVDHAARGSPLADPHHVDLHGRRRAGGAHHLLRHLPCRPCGAR